MDEKLLDFEELFQIFKKLWWIIILCVCITTGLSAYKANKMQPSYSSKVSIFLGMNSQTMDYSTVQQVYFYKNNMGLFKDMIVTEDFYEDVVEKNKFNVSPSEIASCVSFSYAEETPIMYIQYKSLNKENIDKILDAVALEFVERYKEVVVDSSPNIVNSAVVSTAYPNKSRIIIIGFIVGLIAGIGIIFVVDYLDDRIKSRERLEKILDIPVLGAIPTQEKEFGKAGKRYVHSRKNATIGIS